MGCQVFSPSPKKNMYHCLRTFISFEKMSSTARLLISVLPQISSAVGMSSRPSFVRPHFVSQVSLLSKAFLSL